ncbi:hypothetical protein CK203_071000 [Vitis vinifera]|uniref:Disease resistance protein At4g27190-like leucine-rich repeats domain-containing protein n=1 Tax=Vitis vinifera TaxID=29760 RepID=A0A438E9R8_VITVI|nr:hypothetical protein CK203_071000 [Vitis vinifera]
MIYVDYLLECWRAEDFIRHAEEFRKARIRGHAILHELMGVSFLEKTEKRKYVKMNKVLRRLALKISLQKDYKYLAKAREGLQEFPDHEECSQAICEFWICKALGLHFAFLYIQVGFSQRALLKFLHPLDKVFDVGNHTNEQSEIISRFVSLEELSIEVDSSKQLWERVAEKTTDEIATLNKLTSLQFYFLKWTILGKDPVISEVLGKTHAFGLKNHSGVSSLSEFGNENMNHMLVCLLEGCNDIVTIISGGGTITRELENLEILHVNNMLGLASIWNGLVPDGSLGQLTTLTLIKCPELKKVFSNGMIAELPQQQHLRVEECRQIEVIIMEPENGGLAANPLPRLMTLVLLDLPTLKNIWIDDSLNWPSLRKIKISTCRELKKLPFNMLNATRLRSIEGQNSWWNALEWADDGATRQRLEPLCILN